VRPGALDLVPLAGAWVLLHGLGTAGALLLVHLLGKAPGAAAPERVTPFALRLSRHLAALPPVPAHAVDDLLAAQPRLGSSSATTSSALTTIAAP